MRKPPLSGPRKKKNHKKAPHPRLASGPVGPPDRIPVLAPLRAGSGRPPIGGGALPPSRGSRAKGPALPLSGGITSQPNTLRRKPYALGRRSTGHGHRPNGAVLPVLLREFEHECE